MKAICLWNKSQKSVCSKTN